MASILAIDAAWSEGNPSGVALLAEQAGGWQCIALAPSYDSFIGVSEGHPVDWQLEPKGGKPSPESLLKASESLAGGKVDLISVDMPLATTKITGRRAADNLISKQYGGAKCGTHSPNSERPGKVGEIISNGFKASGYPLATTATKAGKIPALMEVYPHPALLTLMKVKERVKYKEGKSLEFWPNTSVADRVIKLLAIYRQIAEKLGEDIGGIPSHLILPSERKKLTQLKRYEDAIDALICGWVGIQYLKGKIKPYGDETACIWTP